MENLLIGVRVDGGETNHDDSDDETFDVQRVTALMKDFTPVRGRKSGC